MNQTPSHAAEPFETMPFAKEIRASAQYSAALRRQADQLFDLMREPFVSEAQTKARWEALQRWNQKPFIHLNPTDAVQKSAVASGGARRLPPPNLI